MSSSISPRLSRSTIRAKTASKHNHCHSPYFLFPVALFVWEKKGAFVLYFLFAAWKAAIILLTQENDRSLSKLAEGWRAHL
jgi:hypothetical protein